MELTRTLPEPVTTGSSRTRTEHVMFVLSPHEQQLFFAGDPRIGQPGVRESWVDASALVSGDWHQVLRSHRPTVLVTAWSCPVIPASWGLDEDCPLRYVCSVTGSVKPRVPRALLERGLLVTNWGSLVSEAVAEHALLMVLALLRSLPLWPELMVESRGMFEMMPRLRSRTLRGKRVGLHGFGAVARELVGMLRPYEVDLAAYSAGVPVGMMEEFGVRPCRTLEELFSHSEILIECEALTTQSKGSVTEAVLRALPEDAVFVNVGRGAVVDEAALIRLVREGRLRAGLDVFHREPMPADSSLLDIPRLLLSPHVAGPTWETYPECGAQAMRNLARYLRGEELENLVSLEIYDRTT